MQQEAAGPGNAIEEEILSLLEARNPAAAFVSEIAATLRATALERTLVQAIHDLDARGRVLVVDHPAPDIHLESLDLRIVARVPAGGAEADAADAAETVWSGWLRAFLATHRCE